MTTRDFSLETVLDYSRRYAQLGRLCVEDVTPAAHRLCALYVSGLRPKRLSLAVSLREPKSLGEARRYAVEEVRKLVGMIRFVDDGVQPVQRIGESMRSGDIQRRVERKTDFVGSPTAGGERRDWQHEQSTVRCHACGGMGHKAYECPSKQRSKERPQTTPVAGGDFLQRQATSATTSGGCGAAS